MGQKKLSRLENKHPKTQLVVNYFLFQKNIEKYLTDWNDKKDLKHFRKGYLVHPDWIKNMKNKIKYEKELKFYLNEFKITSRDITEIQESLLRDFIEANVIRIDFNSINALNMDAENDFPKIKEDFFSLEILKCFINEDAYKNIKEIYEQNKDKKIEKIEIKEIKYIFRRQMLILFSIFDKIIKIILFNENKIKLVNINFNFDNEDIYYEYESFFHKNNSQQILNYLKSINIYENKNYKNYDIKKNKIAFTVTYEEKSEKIYEGRNTDFIRNNIKDKLNENDKEEEEEEEKENKKFRMKRTLTICQKDLNELINKKEILALTFINEGKILMSMTCKSDKPFKDIEEELFAKFPEFKNNYVLFTVNGIIIDRSLTLEENKIKNKDTITVSKTPGFEENEEKEDNNNQMEKTPTLNAKDLNTLINENKIITVTFIADGNRILTPMSCKYNSSFKTYEDDLFKEYPEFQNKDVIFKVNGNTINRQSTIEENKIKNNDIIEVIKKEDLVE